LDFGREFGLEDHERPLERPAVELEDPFDLTDVRRAGTTGDCQAR
jgi:hypothetical protein